MRQLTATEQALPWVRFPALPTEQPAERAQLGQQHTRNHRELIASVDRAWDEGVLLPPIHVFFGRFSDDVPEVWHLWDGCHRLYVALLRGAPGIYAHVSRRRTQEGPIVWLDMQDLNIGAACLDAAFGTPHKPEWDWRDDPRRAALGLPVIPRTA